MLEYVNVSVSSYDPSALAQKLTEKSAEGWEVVAIVPTGSDVTAFLRRESSMAIGGARVDTMAAAAPTPSPSPSPEPVSAPSPEPVSAPTPEPVSEPAGWAAAPEPTPASSSPATVIAGMNDTSSSSSSSSGSGGYGQQAGGYQGGGYQTGGGYQQATPAAQAQPAPAQPAQGQASTPAGWYHDPSGRYELRYWDGSQWTEHVARGGQQYTDPPVA